MFNVSNRLIPIGSVTPSPIPTSFRTFQLTFSEPWVVTGMKTTNPTYRSGQAFNIWNYVHNQLLLYFS